MITCATCPGSTLCSGMNLYQVLVRVFDLYSAGVTNKLDILIALSDEDEAILERYTANISHSCWSKAALLSIVEVIARLDTTDMEPKVFQERVFAVMRTAREAFGAFPWNLSSLADQAVDMYDLIRERCPDAALCDHMKKRNFIKTCIEISYG